MPARDGSRTADVDPRVVRSSLGCEGRKPGPWTDEGEPVRYLLLIYDEPPASEPSQEDWATMMASYGDFTTWLEERGWIRTAAALQDVTTATTVTVRDDQRLVTDGPFAETKEHLGGFYVIDVPGLDDAIEAAARIPGARTGKIEIRPIAETG